MRVILSEDNALLREGLSRLLVEEGHEVAAALSDALSLVVEAERLRPDVVVVDVRMPPSHTDEGLRAALDLRRRQPALPILVLSQVVERRHARELFAAGESGIGYLLKDRVAHVDDFLDALDRVTGGGTAFDPEVIRQLMSTTSHADPLHGLTPRERDVLDLVAQGHTNATICRRLHLSASAVEKHVNAVFTKFDLVETEGYNRRVLAVLRYLGG